FMAPQAIRIDMRQDLEHLEVLKTLPVRAAAILRGELLWPGALMTALSWTMIAIATLMSAFAFPHVGVDLRAAIGGAAPVLEPALVFAQLVIHNGMAIIFPAWVALGNTRSRGLDAMGQRIITLGGTWLLLLVMLLPGAIAGGIIWLALRWLVGAASLVPAALA